MSENEQLITDSSKNRNNGINYFFPCLIASLITCQLSFLGGISQGYSAILLAQLEDSESELQINLDEASWIASFGIICRPIGALAEGFIVDKYGRRTTMQLVSILLAISWLLIYFSRSILMLYFSRILLSFSLGMIICVGLYIVEISKPVERGTFLSFITPFTMCGVLIVYVLGYAFSWATTALILFFYCIIVLMCTFLIPESHIWFMLKSRREEAISSLQWLRRDFVTVETEIKEVEIKLQNMQEKTNYFSHFRDPAVWKPFLILTIFSIFQQQVGYNIIVYYAVDFFSSLGNKDNGNVLSIYFAAISTCGSLLLVLVIHKFKRKSLLAASGIGMAVSMAVGALFLDFEGPRIVPILCVYVYILFCMLGMIDIPWMIVGEMFPSKVRGIMSANVTVVIFCITFLNVKSHTFLNSWLGISGLFWYFAVLSFITVIYAKIFLPETKDKSLFEIEEQYRGKKAYNVLS